MFLGHELRQKRAAHRPVERTHDADQNQHRVYRIDRMRMADRCKEQQRRARGKRGVTCDDEPTAIVAIRYVPRNQEKENARKELRQTYQPEVERPLRNLVYL